MGFPNLEKYLILPNWLQFVGAMIALIGGARAHGLAAVLVFVGVGMAGAGRLYKWIYP